jgi:hypothetical protein
MRKVIEKKINPIFHENHKIEPQNVPIITGDDYKARIDALLKLAAYMPTGSIFQTWNI